jgi:hypothetical protein
LRAAGETETTQENIQAWLGLDERDPGFQLLTEEEIATVIYFYLFPSALLIFMTFDERVTSAYEFLLDLIHDGRGRLMHACIYRTLWYQSTRLDGVTSYTTVIFSPPVVPASGQFHSSDKTREV